MIRALVIGLVASGATIGAEMGARELIILRDERASAAPQRATDARKTHEINVPRIKDGAIKGYAVMLLSFRYVYSDDTIDFDHLDHFDFAKMSKALIRAVNARVKGDVLVDVGVQEFTYAPISDTHQRPGSPATP
jgi:hypothetical protein